MTLDTSFFYGRWRFFRGWFLGRFFLAEVPLAEVALAEDGDG